MKAILQKVKGDKVIWSVVIVLIFISLLIVYSTCSSLAFKKDKHATAYLLKQLMFLGFGVYIIYLVHRINYTKFAKLSVALYLFSLPLLLYTFFFGQKLNGGSRWVHLPVINLSFQSSDFAKLALFVFLARLLSIKQGAIKDWKQGFLPLVLPVGATCALIAPANLSTALMLGATCCILFYIGRVRVKHIMALVGVGMLGFGLLFFVSVATGMGRGPTWKKRLMDFAGKHTTTATTAAVAAGDKNDKSADDVFQVQQAKIAIANGGVFGRGPGHSIMRDTLPEAYSDFCVLQHY